MKKERCDYCENGILEFKIIREYFRYREELVAIENTPVFVCNHCGEHYHNAKIARKLREIVEKRSLIQETIPVPIVNFDQVQLGGQ